MKFLFNFFFVLGIATIINALRNLLRSLYGNFGRKKNFQKLLGSNYVLITGCSSGSGLVLAKELAKDGLNIIGTGHNEEIYKARDECSKFGIEFIPIIADFRNNESVNELIEIVKSKNICAYYLNAGFPMFNNFFTFSERQITDFMSAMVINQAVLAHAFILQCKKRENKCLIYLTSSMAGQAPWPLGQLYCSSKAFISSFGKHLSNELSIDSKIFVQTIHPSYFRNSNFMDKLPKHSADLFQRFNDFYQTSEDVGKILYKTALNEDHIDTSLSSIVIRFLWWLITPIGGYYFGQYLAYSTPLD